MKKLLLVLVAIFSVTAAFAGGDDVMITRDGSFITVKVLRISNAEIVFVDLKKKKRGELKAPVDYVYMILKEKGNNLFFDEEGNQTTSPAVKIDDKDNMMFLNNGKFFPIYNFTINKDEVVYQLKDKKKAPLYKSSKAEIFLIRNADGTTTLFNNSYAEKHRKTASASSSVTPPVQAPATAQSAPSSSAVSSPGLPKADAEKQAPSLLLTNGNADFSPAPDLSPQEIEMKVNAANPYTLYRKGSVAEYAFESNGKQVAFMGGPSYVQQTVADGKIENGLFVVYVQQSFFNKKHEPSKGISASFKSYYYPTEIDTAGTYHLTHDISRDYMLLSKRQGYAMLFPSQLKAGDNMRCSTINDNAKNLFGGIVKASAVYSDFQVIGEEQVTTPAGTFDCVKLSGSVQENNGSATVNYRYNWWMARGIGFVKYEIYTIDDKNKDKVQAPLVIYLNKIELK